MPSYKKDAIRLIFHRLSRYMTDVFRDLERYSIEEGIKKQREVLQLLSMAEDHEPLRLKEEKFTKNKANYETPNKPFYLTQENDIK